MKIKNKLTIAFVSCLSLNLFGQVETKETLQVKPNIVQTVSVNSDHPYFEISNLALFPDNELLVYNRWGNEIYKAEPYTGKWYCTSAEKNPKETVKLIESGTYFYIFKDKKTQITYQGYFNFLN